LIQISTGKPLIGTVEVGKVFFLSNNFGNLLRQEFLGRPIDIMTQRQTV